MTYNEVLHIIEMHFKKKPICIRSIGNDDLNRHKVYFVDLGLNEKMIFKVYGRENRRNREIAALKMFEKSDVPVPKILKIGNEFNLEWMATEFIDGVTIEKASNEMSRHEKKEIFYEMGNLLKKVHSNKQVNFFGDWNERGESIYTENKFEDAFKRRLYSTIETLKKADIPDKEICLKASNKLKENFEIIKKVNKPCVCHNDFDWRNILVHKNNGKWKIKSLIDFEQCIPWDRDYDFMQMYHKYFLKDKAYKKKFFEGYGRDCNKENGFDEKLNYYLLYMGVMICSWSYKIAPSYYLEGKLLVERYIDL